MNNYFFVQLSIQNISKHRQTYFPYMSTVSAFVSMFYILLFLRDNVITSENINTTVITYMLTLALVIFGAFVVVFLIYSNNYLIRPRIREFGLLYLFGLSQRHLLLIMCYEIVITYAIATIFGLISGVILSRLMSMVLSAFTRLPLIMDQVINVEHMLITVGLFFSVICVVLIVNMVQIVSAKPISLLQNPVRSKAITWLQYVVLVCGVICIGYAYWSMSSVDSPQRAYDLMSSIVLTIIIGTYCLFWTLSVIITRILEQRPAFYYRTNNFITINGLLNRIRHNAFGLANVSMFALLILTIVSMSAALYMGVNESVRKMYAADIVLTFQDYNVRSKSILQERVLQVASSQGVDATIIEPYVFLSLSMEQSNNSFTYEAQNRVFVGRPTSHYFVLVTAKEYNKLYGESLSLEPGEVAVYSSYRQLPDTFELQGSTYRIVKRLPVLSIAKFDLPQLVNAHYMIVHDHSVLEMYEQSRYLQNELYPAPIRYRVGINISGTEEQQLATYNVLQEIMRTDEVIIQEQRFPNPVVTVVNAQSRQAEKISFEAAYGTILFLGLFLGVLFIFSTALIIYYKQLSEGYEDKTRYEILQRIGMTRDEVRVSVDKQIILVFFIPLIVASVHFGMSIQLIEYLLELFRIESTQLLVVSSISTLLVFSVLYLLIYRVSARVYYNIVR